MAYGPSMEPAWAQVNLAMNLLNRPSVDPSRPVPFWDKSRLLFHGRLTVSLEQCNMLWLTTKDPYNTTEQLDWEWRNIYLDWTNGRCLILIFGTYFLLRVTCCNIPIHESVHIPCTKA